MPVLSTGLGAYAKRRSCPQPIIPVGTGSPAEPASWTGLHSLLPPRGTALCPLPSHTHVLSICRGEDSLRASERRGARSVHRVTTRLVCSQGVHVARIRKPQEDSNLRPAMLVCPRPARCQPNLHPRSHSPYSFGIRSAIPAVSLGLICLRLHTTGLKQLTLLRGGTQLYG